MLSLPQQHGMALEYRLGEVAIVPLGEWLVLCPQVSLVYLRPELPALTLSEDHGRGALTSSLARAVLEKLSRPAGRVIEVYYSSVIEGGHLAVWEDGEEKETLAGEREAFERHLEALTGFPSLEAYIEAWNRAVGW